ncbi:unnamed protein product [Pleuronectes platessa]|uniref:Uncharacterized protein n=1 Tax=Pleuronectes platessa TaxID=8262 RepID=A0A9N7Y987_PLEPL|nr:unnamed protein product [Pleuronectes platessa]
MSLSAESPLHNKGSAHGPRLELNPLVVPPLEEQRVASLQAARAAGLSAPQSYFQHGSLESLRRVPLRRWDLGASSCSLVEVEEEEEEEFESGAATRSLPPARQSLRG